MRRSASHPPDPPPPSSASHIKPLFSCIHSQRLSQSIVFSVLKALLPLLFCPPIPLLYSLILLSFFSQPWQGHRRTQIDKGLCVPVGLPLCAPATATDCSHRCRKQNGGTPPRPPQISIRRCVLFLSLENRRRWGKVSPLWYFY